MLLWLYHDTWQAKYMKYDLKSYLHIFLFELKNPIARMEVWKKFWRRPNFNPNFITSPLITKSLWASPEFNGISCPQPDIHKLKRNRGLLAVKGYPNLTPHPIFFFSIRPQNLAEWQTALKLELITFEILAAKRLRLMWFDNRLIIYCFANVVNIFIWLFATNDRFRSEKYQSIT